MGVGRGYKRTPDEIEAGKIKEINRRLRKIIERLDSLDKTCWEHILHDDVPILKDIQEKLKELKEKY